VGSTLTIESGSLSTQSFIPLHESFTDRGVVAKASLNVTVGGQITCPYVPQWLAERELGPV